MGTGSTRLYRPKVQVDSVINSGRFPLGVRYLSPVGKMRSPVKIWGSRWQEVLLIYRAATNMAWLPNQIVRPPTPCGEYLDKSGARLGAEISSFFVLAANFAGAGPSLTRWYLLVGFRAPG